jgi:tetratricopeptide (TPR) repeat protein
VKIRLLILVAVVVLTLPAAFAALDPSRAQTPRAQTPPAQTPPAQTPAQPPPAQWSWPEKAKNLKQLPPDTDKAKLRAVMTGFTRSLGVRCSYCHVGKEGEPLSTYDFASDDNPKKEIARGMLKMLGSVNEQLKQIRPADTKDPVNMWCNTCHHGVPRPRTLVEELSLTYDAVGVDSTIAKYNRLRTAYDNAGVYDFREGSLNAMGYHALEKKDTAGAIALFKLNAENYPGSSNVHDSLAEAYLAAGDTTKSITEYERSYSIDPHNDNAVKMLQALHR